MTINDIVAALQDSRPDTNVQELHVRESAGTLELSGLTIDGAPFRIRYAMPTRPRTHSACPPAPKQEKRLSPAARGYGHKWRQFRMLHASMVPAICEAILPSGKVCGHAGASDEMHLDHKIPVTGPNDPSFMSHDAVQWLCESCHARKTAMEDGGFGNAK